MGLVYWALIIVLLILEYINVRGIVKPVDNWRLQNSNAPKGWRAFNMSMLGPWSAWRLSSLTYCEDTELPRIDESKVASEVYLHGPHNNVNIETAEIVGPWPGALEDPRLAYDSHGHLAVSMSLFDGKKSAIQITWPHDGLHVRLQSETAQKNWVPVPVTQHLGTQAHLIMLASVPNGPNEVGVPVKIDRPIGPKAAVNQIAPTVRLGKWRGSTNFAQLPDGRLIGLVHRRQDPRYNLVRYMTARGLPMYDHAIQILEGHWPFKCVSMSRSLDIKVRGFNGPMFVFPMSLEIDNIDNICRVSVGISDCYSAYAHVPVQRLLELVQRANDPTASVLHLTLEH